MDSCSTESLKNSPHGPRTVEAVNASSRKRLFEPRSQNHKTAANIVSAPIASRPRDAAFPGRPGSWIGLADDPAETKRMVRLIDPLVRGGSVHVNHPPSRLATRRGVCRYARPCAPPLRVLNRQISRRSSDHAHDDLGHAMPVRRDATAHAPDKRERGGDSQMRISAPGSPLGSAHATGARYGLVLGALSAGRGPTAIGPGSRLATAGARVPSPQSGFICGDGE